MSKISYYWTERDMTPWFPPEILPARQGVYQTILWAGALLQYSYWDGELWSMGYDTADEAGVAMRPRSSFKRYWRGLSREPFDIDQLCDDAMERIKRQIDASAHEHLVENARLGSEIAEAMYVRHRDLKTVELVALTEWELYVAERERRWLRSHGVVL